MQNRRISLWLRKFPKHIRDKAVANSNKRQLNSKIRSLYGALNSAFTWDESDDGVEYWANISRNLNHIETYHIKMSIAMDNIESVWHVDMLHELVNKSKDQKHAIQK